MSRRGWVMRVEDMLEAIREIGRFVDGLTFEQFASDPKTLRATVADFIIIGEAAAAVPEEIVIANPDVPWRVMKRMRNTLVHAYFAIDPRIVWETARNDLPALLAPLEAMLRESGGDPG